MADEKILKKINDGFWLNVSKGENNDDGKRINNNEIKNTDNRGIINNNFNKYKGELKIFSEKMEEEIKLPTVNYTGGILGWSDHKVTGWELNKLTEKIQDHLVASNNISNKIIKEFETIYKTFNALDNEYIKEIMQSIEKSNEAINKANQGLMEAEKRIEDIKATNLKIEVAQNNIKVIQDELKYAQKDIDKHIEIQKKIVEGLSQFKSKMDSYEHLKDIDSIWNDLNYLKKEKDNSHVLEEQQKKIENLETSLEASQNENQSLYKKINTSYFIASGALFFTLFNISYLFLRG